MKLHPCSLLLLIYFAFNFSVCGIDFFLKNLLYPFFLFQNHQILEQVEKIILWKKNLRAHSVGFAAFFNAMGNWREKLCIPCVVKDTIRWESDEKKVPILREKYGYQFPRLSQFDRSCFVFLCYGNCWGNPCFSHVIKYTIESKSNGKKAPIL